MPFTIKQFDTYPPWVFTLSDEEGYIALTGANAIKLIAQLQGGTTLIGPVIMTLVGEVTFTASSTLGSLILTGVSTLAGITEGSTLIGAPIPLGAVVDEIDTVGNKITMSQGAIATAAAVSCIANRGMATYTPTSTDTSHAGMFNCECAIHWDSGTSIQKVPNAKAANPQIQIDPDLLGTTE